VPIKVKSNLKSAKQITQEIKDKFVKEISTGESNYELIRILQDVIRKGLSPVDGEGRFEKYSASYKRAIKKGDLGPEKKPSPVSMYLTGEMLGSLRVVEKNGKAILEFEDEKAVYHQKGKGKLPVRKLLPTGRFETFNKRILQVLINALKKAVKK
jgi:hypothetical protein